MVRDTEPASGWSLTHVRTGVCGSGDALDCALFSFGREHTEMHMGDSLRLPTAVIEMIEETGLGDEAMETGFVLEIRSKRPPSGGRGLCFRGDAAEELRSIVPPLLDHVLKNTLI